MSAPKNAEGVLGGSKAVNLSMWTMTKINPDTAINVGERRMMTMTDYVTKPSENFAVREGQVASYHPKLCHKHGQTHKAYGWSKRYEFGWDAAQKTSYDRGYEGKSNEYL